MKILKFGLDDCMVSKKDLEALEKKLAGETGNLIDASNSGYDDVRASINLPYDYTAIGEVKAVIEEKKSLDPDYLVVVGIGGSNLGAKAVQEAVQGKEHNLTSEGIKVLYADTVDSDSMAALIRIIRPVLEGGGNVIINGISKSGKTTETLANFEVLVKLLQGYKQDYEKYVVVTTDRDSAYWKLAKSKGFDVLEIPGKVGGRYSVFSPVGLFPLGLLGLDIDELLSGARVMRDHCLKGEQMKNPAAVSAALIYLHRLAGIRIHDLFLFGKDLESIGKWYRQLMGESVGKEYDLNGRQVFEGVTPTVSIGSIDLHSMAQLYLGGPFDKFTTFVNVKSNRAVIDVPGMPEYLELVSGIQGKTLHEVMDAILGGVKEAYRKKGRPFMEIRLEDTSEHSIGQLLQFKMLEMMYLGSLLEVDPFNQPAVESYKEETRKILGGRI